jgi:flagellar biosynthetic protein FliR
VTLSVEIAWVITVLLVSIRLGILLLLTPLLGGHTIPIRVGVLLVLALSGTIVLGAGIKAAPLPSNSIDLIVLAARELVMGALLAAALFAAFGAFLLGGRILDMQIGFGFATLVDPMTRNQTPLLGAALHLMMAVIFFAVDGHHVIIRLLAASFQMQAPGMPITLSSVELAIAQFGMMFVWGIALVAPALFALLLLDVALAIMSRTMPQMHIFIVAIPVKVFVGLTMLAISVSVMGPTIQKILNSTFGLWQKVLG